MILPDGRARIRVTVPGPDLPDIGEVIPLFDGRDYECVGMELNKAMFDLILESVEPVVLNTAQPPSHGEPGYKIIEGEL